MTAEKVQKKVHKVPKDFDKKQVQVAFEALHEHVSKRKEDALFLDAATRFLLDVTTFKTPSGQNHFYNIVLPNSPFPDIAESLDVLLVVRDVKGKEPEQVVGEVQDELRNSAKFGEFKVRQVMTLKQFKDDYSTYEAKRALAKSVDVVIGENNFFKMMQRILGREFYLKKKFPLGIPGREFKGRDLGEQICHALQKTVFSISVKGQTSTIVVGHDNLGADELAENVSKIANWINRKFPGGWRNVQKLAVHAGINGVPPLVVFFSTGSAKEVTKSTETSGHKMADAVVDEISTQPGKKVRITADGMTNVYDDKTMSKEDQDLCKDLELGKRKISRKNKRNKRSKKDVTEVLAKKEEPKDEVKSEDGEEDDEEDDTEEVKDEQDEEVEAEEVEDGPETIDDEEDEDDDEDSSEEDDD